MLKLNYRQITRQRGGRGGEGRGGEGRGEEGRGGGGGETLTHAGEIAYT